MNGDKKYIKVETAFYALVDSHNLKVILLKIK
jgi:hypothetical protein